MRKQTDLSTARVLVVDNGSTDETPEKLKAYPWLKVLTNDRNLGFVRGNNAGIAAADPESDVLLLNNDIEIHQPDWLEKLREAAHSSPDVGLVGCRLVFPDGKLIHAGTYILPDTFWGQQIGSLETNVNQYAATRDVQGIVFACAYIRREVIAKIGDLSEEFESYFEDTDYCLRAREAGFRTVCCGAVTLVHDEHGSTSDTPRLFNRLFKKSRRTFRAKWAGRLEARYTRPLAWQSIMNFPTGYAMSCREILRGLDAEGVRVAYQYVYGKGTPFPLEEPDQSGDHLLNAVRQRKMPSHPPVSVVYGQGDVFRKNRGRYRIGYTMLEVDGFPKEWVRQANAMDEVWVPTTFNREGFVRCGVTKPVHVMPLGVDVDHFHPRISNHPNPQRRLRLSLQLRVGRKEGAGAAPEGIQPDLPPPRPRRPRVQGHQPERRPERAKRDRGAPSQGLRRPHRVHSQPRVPVPRAGLALPVGRLLRFRGTRRGLGHAAHGGDGLRPAHDCDRLGRAHGIPSRRDRVSAPGPRNHPGEGPLPLLRRLLLGRSGSGTPRTALAARVREPRRGCRNRPQSRGGNDGEVDLGACGEADRRAAYLH